MSLQNWESQSTLNRSCNTVLILGTLSLILRNPTSTHLVLSLAIGEKYNEKSANQKSPLVMFLQGLIGTPLTILPSQTSKLRELTSYTSFTASSRHRLGKRTDTSKIQSLAKAVQN